MRVFPVPADASSATLKRGSTARSRPTRSRASMRDSTVSGSASNGSQTSLGIDVVLATDRRIGAPGADDRFVRTRRKRTLRDAVGNIKQTLSRPVERGLAPRPPHTDDREVRLLPGEREVGGLVDRPRPAVAR